MCAYPLVYGFKKPTPLKVPTLSKFLTSKKMNFEQFPFNHRKSENYINLEAVLLLANDKKLLGGPSTLPLITIELVSNVIDVNSYFLKFFSFLYIFHL